MTRKEICDNMETKLLGTFVSVNIGGVDWPGEVRGVRYFTQEKVYKAKCKFYNEERYFFKLLTTEGELCTQD